MQTVVETKSYLSGAKAAGMTDADCAEVVDAVANDPTIGTHLGGGVRKFRFAGRGKGKSGGYRIVHFFDGIDIPAVLLAVFGKGEKANLTRVELNSLIAYAKTVRESLSRKK